MKRTFFLQAATCIPMLNVYEYRFLPGKDPVWFDPEIRKQYIDQLVTQN